MKSHAETHRQGKKKKKKKKVGLAYEGKEKHGWLRDQGPLLGRENKRCPEG